MANKIRLRKNLVNVLAVTALTVAIGISGCVVTVPERASITCSDGITTSRGEHGREGGNGHSEGSEGREGASASEGEESRAIPSP